MASVKLKLHRVATKEYTAAIGWYELQRPGLGAEFFDKFQEAKQKIRDDPLRWPLYDDIHRYVQLRKFPYIVPYRIVASDRVSIMAVAHLKKRPGYWRRRKP